MGLFDFIGDIIGGVFGLFFPAPDRPKMPKTPKIPELKLPKQPVVDAASRRRQRLGRGLRSGFGSTLRGGMQPTTGLLGTSSSERASRSVKSTLG